MSTIRKSPKSIAPLTMFSTAIATAARTADTRGSLPILACLRVVSEGGETIITATDMEQHVSLRLPFAVSETPLDAVVNAKALSAAVKMLPAGSIPNVIRMRDLVHIGRSTIPTMPAEDYPQFSAPTPTVSFDLPAATLLHALNRASVAMSTEQSRYYLNGVCLAVEPNGLAFVATDGHRLARQVIPMPSGLREAGTEQFWNVIIPFAAVKELITILKKTDDNATVTTCGKRLAVTLGATVYTTKLVDGTFPEYQRVIPMNNPLLAEFTLADFTRAVSTARTPFAGSRGYDVVKMELADYAATFSGEYDGVTASDTVALVGTSPDFTGGYQGNYLLSLTKHHLGNVTFHADEPTGHALILDANDPGYTAVVMPIRL